MKKAVAILLISVLLCVMLAAILPTFAQQTNGFCGAERDNLTWNFDSETGELSISGEGEMMYLEMFEAPWEALKDSVKSVRIGSGVTSVGRFAFYEYPALESVVFEENSALERIEYYAFYNCDLITEIDIPDGVTYIDNSAFGHCDGLVNVSVPNSVAFIGTSAFPIYAPNLVCTELEGLKYIGNEENPYLCLYVAADKNITSVAIHEDTKFILTEAFNYCMTMNSVELPQGLISIGSSAFRYCRAIENIVIPEGVEYIGERAFEGCVGIAEMNIPSGVKSIGGFAFYYCTALTEVIIPGTVETLGTNIFSNCDLLESVTLFTGTTEVSSRLFEHCKALKTVKLIGGTTSVEYMFYGCEALERVIYCGTLENFERVSASAIRAGVPLSWHDLVESNEPVLPERTEKGETTTDTSATTTASAATLATASAAASTTANTGNYSTSAASTTTASTGAATQQPTVELKPYLCLVCGEIVMKEPEATSGATSIKTAAKTTSKAPSGTTNTEEETTEAPVISSETSATEQSGSKSGCQSLLSGGAVIVGVVSLAGFAIAKRRDEE